MAATEGLGRSAGALAEKPVLTTSEGARALTDAVNPHAQSMETYEATLNDQMPRVVDYAKRNGIEIKSRASLGKALSGAGDEAYHDYYEQYIEPNKDVPVSTSTIPGYQGVTVGEGHTATIQALENRLSTINATLYPKFQKGGVSAEAAISAEAAASLNSEAAAIRQTMNQTIGRKLGIDPGEIAKLRSTFGSLRDAADKTTRAINEERFGKNLERRGMDVPGDKAGAVRWAVKKITAKNPDKTVASTMQRLNVETPKPATTALPEQGAPFPRKPSWQGKGASDTEIGVSRTQQSEIAAHQQRMQQRVAQAQQAMAAREQAHQQARQKITNLATALRNAAEKLGGKASVKEIMAEANKAAPQ